MKTILGVIAIAVTMAYVGPALDDNGYEQAQDEELEQAIKQAKQAERFDKAARAICGQNAGYRLQADGSIRCLLKNGKPTTTVARMN